MTLFAEKVMPVVRQEIDGYLDDLYPNAPNHKGP